MKIAKFCEDCVALAPHERALFQGRDRGRR